jgi:hypothetical protein
MEGDIQNRMHILHDGWNYKKARFWFWPIVTGFTVLFGFFNGTEGAFIGFLYGVVAGLLLIHESLMANKRMGK